MSEDLRNSLKLWAGGIAGMALFWVGVRWDLLTGLIEKVPANWFWLAMGILAISNLGQFGWGLWQRRASNPANPNHR